MAFTVIYDACVLFPPSLRDLLVRLAMSGIVRARWTDEILDECFGNIQKKYPDLDPAKLAKTRALMNAAVLDCLVTGHMPLVPALTLPDPDDRHVLAAAIAAGAQGIVTLDMGDFPKATLATHNIEPIHPDDFVVHQIDLNAPLVARIIEAQSSALTRKPHSPTDILNGLLKWLPMSVAKLRPLVKP